MDALLSAPNRWPPPVQRAAKRRPRPYCVVECFSVPKALAGDGGEGRRRVVEVSLGLSVMIYADLYITMIYLFNYYISI